MIMKIFLLSFSHGRIWKITCMLIHAKKGFGNQKIPSVAETNKELCCVYSYVCKRVLIVKALDAKNFVGLSLLLRCFSYLPPLLCPLEKILLSIGDEESCGEL